MSVPRVKLTFNDEGEHTDIEYTDAHNGGRPVSPHASLPSDENNFDIESVRQAILSLKKQVGTSNRSNQVRNQS